MVVRSTPFRYVRDAALSSRPSTPFRYVRDAALTPRPSTPFRWERGAPIIIDPAAKSSAVQGLQRGLVLTDVASAVMGLARGLVYSDTASAVAGFTKGTPLPGATVIPYIKDTGTGLGRPAVDTDEVVLSTTKRVTAGGADLWTDNNTTTIDLGGGATQSTITIGKSGVANKINGYVNIQGATSAGADGDFAVGDGVSELFFDASSASLKNTAANGQAWNIQFTSTELTGLSGASATASSLIPAGSLVVGVVTRVTTAVTGATTYDVGDGSDVDRWGAAIAIALGTTSDPTNYTDNTLQWSTAANDVVLTANGSSFTAGAVRITVAYISLTAPTS